MSMTRKAFAIFAMLLSMSVGASSLSDIEYGYTLQTGMYSVDDPDGDTKKITEIAPFNFYALFPGMKRHHRWSTRFGILKTEVDASEKEIGQKIVRQYIEGGYRVSYGFTRKIKLWFDGGAGYSDAQFGSRHKIDKDGYLSERFDKRQDASPYAYGSVTHYWDMNKSTQIGAELRGEYSLGNNISGISLGITIKR